MQVRVFSLAFDAEQGGFDDNELVAFCREHQVTQVAHYVVQAAGMPWLAVLVTWRVGAGDVRSTTDERRGTGRGRQGDPTHALTPDERTRYEALRQWRNQQARESGKPPYLLFSNTQAAEIARAMPASLTGLGQIAGIGPSKIDAWGAAVLDVLAGVAAEKVGVGDVGDAARDVAEERSDV